MTCNSLSAAIACCLLLPGMGRPLPAQESAANRWESEIAQMEQRNRPRLTGSVKAVFVGSSSIRMWDLSSSFPGCDVLNCGFGGSHLADVCQFADRLILPYRPEIVFVYAGDNDLAAGKPPARISQDFAQLVKQIHVALPDTHIVYLSIKPSPQRWSLFPRMQQANSFVQKQTEADERLHFLDVGQVLLDAHGVPQRDLFREDGLHLNDAGYQRWTRLVQPYLEQTRATLGSAD